MDTEEVQPLSLAGPVFGLWILAAVATLLPVGSEHGSIFFAQPVLTAACIAAVVHAITVSFAPPRRSRSVLTALAIGLISGVLALVTFSLSWGEGALGAFSKAPQIAGMTMVFSAVVAVLITLLYIRRKLPEAQTEGRDAT